MTSPLQQRLCQALSWEGGWSSYETAGRIHYLNYKLNIPEVPKSEKFKMLAFDTSGGKIL